MGILAANIGGFSFLKSTINVTIGFSFQRTIFLSNAWIYLSIPTQYNSDTFKEHAFEDIDPILFLHEFFFKYDIL